MAELQALDIRTPSPPSDGTGLGRLRRTAWWAMGGLALLAVFLWAWHPVYDFDVWFDLRQGTTILQTHHVSDFQYIWEAAEYHFETHRLNDEWGFAVLVRLLWGWGGSAALSFYTAGTATLMVFLNAWTARRLGARWWSIAFSVVVFVVLVQPRLMPRPQLLTDVFLAAFMLVSTARPRVYLAFPLLMIAWCNFHAGCFSGVVLCGCLLVGDLVEWVWQVRHSSDRRLPDSVRMLLAVVLLCLAAMMVCPAGPHLLGYVIENFTSSYRPVQWVAEWAPMGLDNHLFWTSAVLLMAGLLRGVVLGTCRWRHVFIAAGFTYLAIRYGRSVSDYAATTTALLALAVEQYIGLSYRQRLCRIESTWPALVAGLGVVLLLAGVGWQRRPREEYVGPQVNGAVTFLRLAHVPPRLFNSYHLGGLLAWEGAPDYLPFIHGITSLLPDRLLLAYQEVTYGNVAGHAALRHFGITAMVLGYPVSEGDSTSVCLQWVEKDPGWKLVYWDDDTLVYVPANLPGRPASFDYVVPADPQSWKVTDPGVQQELERAVQLAPQSSLALCWLGNCYARQGRVQDALQSFRRAAVARPFQPRPHGLMGELLGQQGQVAAARQELLTAWDLGTPTGPDAYNIALLSDKMGDMAAARHWAEVSRRLSPDFVPTLRLLQNLQ